MEILDAPKLSKTWLLTALEAFKTHLSGQTSLIHFNMEQPFVEHHDTISIYHNFLYILTLFKTHQVSDMQEGARLLDHLLCFQIEGKFPHYLHNFPFVKPSHVQIDILVPLFWIVAEYKKAMPEPLYQRLFFALERQFASALEFSHKTPLNQFKLICFDRAWGSLLNREFKVIDDPILPYLESSQEMSELLIFANLLYNTPFQATLEKCFAEVISHFHLKTSSYIGPIVNEKWVKETPQCSLVHALMAELNEEAKPIEFQKGDFQFKYTLIDPGFFQQLYRNERSFRFCDAKYLTAIREEDHLTSLKLSSDFNPCQSFFNYTFGTFHLTGYMGSFEVKSQFEDNEVIMSVHLTTPFNPEDCRSPILSFFINRPEDIRILVEGRPATVFSARDNVSIQTQDVELDLQFSCQNEERFFMGQISRSNRPSQLCATKFDAYDLCLNIRATRWEVGEVLTLKLTIPTEAFNLND
ncbi:MAG: hypothetical protein K9M07_06330 [Simkaniaceae bacterium]|nr:hypothetical protein [Simkaniaceae bacterium]MCF7852839.1 hypothetical protein [Simkaniaceae bacterium]